MKATAQALAQQALDRILELNLSIISLQLDRVKVLEKVLGTILVDGAVAIGVACAEGARELLLDQERARHVPRVKLEERDLAILILVEARVERLDHRLRAFRVAQLFQQLTHRRSLDETVAVHVEPPEGARHGALEPAERKGDARVRDGLGVE